MRALKCFNICDSLKRAQGADRFDSLPIIHSDYNAERENMLDYIDRPIFLLGPGRAGSTLFHNLLTLHRDIGYFISWSNKYPKYPWLAVGARFRIVQIETKAWYIKGYPGPAEAYGIWKHCFPDFWRICHSACVDEAGVARLKHQINMHLRAQGKSRFLAKLTGPPMLAFFKSIFPDARFVWLDRDPRAVCYSYYRRGWISAPADIKDSLDSDERLRYAARRYLKFYNEIRQEQIPHYWVRYEDFINAPVEELISLMNYLELDSDARLVECVSRWPIQSHANQSWEKALSSAQQKILNEMLEEPLREKGYCETTNLKWDNNETCSHLSQT